MIYIETYYLIDFENVHNDGLIGCDRLKKTDHIHLFYTENADTIKLNILNNHGDAELKIHNVAKGNQSLDMHLVSYLGYLIGYDKDKDSAYIIVSKDKDYDKVIEFWKKGEKAKISRISKIMQPLLKTSAHANQSTPANQSASQKSELAKQSTKVIGENKTKLNQEVQQVLSQKKYDKDYINPIAKLVTEQYGKEHFLNQVHNVLRQKYTNYLELYEVIKPIISKYDTFSTTSSYDISASEKKTLYRDIQQILSRAGKESEVIDYVASTVVKNIDVKNGKQQIYRTIVSKYGQVKGLDLYNRIKKRIS